MSQRVIPPLWLYCLLNILALSVVSVWLFQQNQPVAVTSATQLLDKKLQCVSYAPHYKKGDSPHVKGMWITPAQIDHDLKLLSNISHCVRTYSVGQGMDYVPEAAAKIGMKVYLGAWVGWTDAANVKEIKLATKVANAYPETIKGLIVGNEVFLRGEQDEAAMQRYFALAKRLTAVPITYADVWEFWIKHQKMAKHIDFHTVHLLPYWENDPVAIADAMQHAETVMATMESTFSKPILIGETGWPSVGRQRGESQPSLINQARYVREFVQKAQAHKWQYNIIEAIDQPWKRSLEGTVGGYWGLFTFDLKPKFALTGAVAERQDQYQFVWAGLLGAALFLLLAKKLNEQRRSALLGLGALGAVAAMMALLKLAYVVSASRDWIEWLALGGLAILGSVLLLVQPWLVSGKKTQAAIKLTATIKLLFIYAALVTGYLIFFDGRYRDFPIMLFLVPAFVMATASLLRPTASAMHWVLYAIPAALSVMFAVLCFEKELNNHAALLWLLLTLLLAIANWPRQRNNLTTSKKIKNN